MPIRSFKEKQISPLHGLRAVLLRKTAGNALLSVSSERFALENICRPGPYVLARRFHASAGAVRRK